MARYKNEKKKKKASSVILTIVSVLLAIVGIALLLINPIRNYVLEHQVSQHQIANVTLEEIKENKQKEAEFNYEAINPISIQTVLQASLNNARVPSIGGISVPSVGVNLTIAKGVSDYNMLVGAGTLRADQEMGIGNYPLASHFTEAANRTLLFTPLLKIEDGAMIYLTDLTNVYAYQVYWKDHITADRVDLVENEGDDKIVTLITCDDADGIGRFAVRGRLQATYPLADAPQEAKDAFKLVSRTLG